MGHDLSPTEAARQARLYAQKLGEQRLINQIIAKESFQEWADKGDFDIIRRFRTLEEEKAKGQKIKAAAKKEHLEEDEAQILVEEASLAEDLAQNFHKKNPELKTKTLLLLRSMLSLNDTAEDILQKVLSVYKDYSLADEALEFLFATTQKQLQENVKKALTIFRRDFAREIAAGKNIYEESRKFSEEGLGNPTALREMYRDITGNIRTPLDLFEELFQEYEYALMEPMIGFLLSSYGADLRSKGPSIDRAELIKLVDDARTLQAILGVYRFFKERMGLIENQFTIYETGFPTIVTFEMLAKMFLETLKQTYPSPLKFRDVGKMVKVYKNLAAEIIIFTQMRDAIRRVSLRLYRNERHRKSMLQTWIDLLEELEKDYEEEE